MLKVRENQTALRKLFGGTAHLRTLEEALMLTDHTTIHVFVFLQHFTAANNRIQRLEITTRFSPAGISLQEKWT